MKNEFESIDRVAQPAVSFNLDGLKWSTYSRDKCSDCGKLLLDEVPLRLWKTKSKGVFEIVLCDKCMRKRCNHG